MSGLVPVSETDYLDQDPPLRGQNFVCLSFISPEDVIKKKEHFFFGNFIQHFSREMQELFSNFAVRYPKDADNLRMLKERYSYLFDSTQIGGEYDFFVSEHGGSLQKLFDEENNFQTSVRGIKVRGVFDTIREAQIRAEVLKKLDGKFNVYVAEVGCWCPWSPNPDEIENQEFAEAHLNTMMKHYKENQMTKDAFYEERKRELQFMKVKKDIEADADPWMKNKDEETGDAGASTSGSTSEEQPKVVFTSEIEPVVEEESEEVKQVVEEIITNVVEQATTATVSEDQSLPADLPADIDP